MFQPPRRDRARVWHARPIAGLPQVTEIVHTIFE